MNDTSLLSIRRENRVEEEKKMPRKYKSLDLYIVCGC